MDDATLGGSVRRNLASGSWSGRNDWLCWDLDALAEACLSLEVGDDPSEAGASGAGVSSALPRLGAGVPAWDQSFGFFMPGLGGGPHEKRPSGAFTTDGAGTQKR